MIANKTKDSEHCLLFIFPGNFRYKIGFIINKTPEPGLYRFNYWIKKKKGITASRQTLYLRFNLEHLKFLWKQTRYFPIKFKPTKS